MSDRPIDRFSLMDIQMPVMNGMEATRKIREWEKKSSTHVLIVAMTAHTMAGDFEKYWEAGMDGYVSKPIRSDQLYSEINRLTEPRQSEIAARETNKNMPSGAVDLQALLERVDNDRDLMRELLVVFQQEFPRHHEALVAAVAGGDLKRLELTSHTLKGMLSNLSVVRGAAAAARLEELARSKQQVGLTAALEEFEREIATLMPELAAYMAEMCP